MLVSRNVLYVSSVYKRNALPGRTRPARPARCKAEAFDIGVTIKASIPVFGLYART